MTGRPEVIFEDNTMKLLRLETAPFGTNAYMVICPQQGESVLVDAPGGGAVIGEQLAKTRVKYILMTHGHMDHTPDLEVLHRELGAVLAVHEADAGRLPVKPDRLLKGGEKIECGRISLEVLHTPGHTPGSLCFLAGGYLISGDTIFPGGPGKTASPADFRQILASIEAKIMPLPDETVLLPGHGQKTDLKTERKLFNAFRSGRQDYELSGDVTWLGS